MGEIGVARISLGHLGLSKTEMRLAPPSVQEPALRHVLAGQGNACDRTGQ